MWTEFDKWGKEHKKIVTDNDTGELYNAEFFPELREAVIRGDDINSFVTNRQKKLHKEYTDEIIAPFQKQKENLQKDAITKENAAKTLGQLNSRIDEFDKDMDKLIMAYPPRKKEQVVNLMKAYANYGHFPEREVVRLKEQPQGVLDRLKNGGKVKKANESLDEFMQKYENHNLQQDIENLSYENMDYTPGKADLLQKLSNIAQENYTQSKDNTKNITSEMQKLTHQAELSKNGAEENNFLEEKYEQAYKDSGSLTAEVTVIKNFAQKKQDILRNPPQMDPEEIKKHGLSEEFIEGQILQGKYPEKARRSIRRSYEGLDRPAAPIVAFSADYEAVLQSLQNKGLDAVMNTDSRATEPSIFVVDKDEKAIHAPFLAPDEALKANIMMIDSIYENNGQASRSSPMTRENMVVATNKDLSNGLRPKQDAEYQMLDLETVASFNPKIKYDEITTEFAEQHLQGDKENFDILLKKVEKEDPKLHRSYIKELQEKLQPLISKDQDKNKKVMNNIAHEFMQEHKQELLPYAKNYYQDGMLEEAFSKGDDPKYFSDENNASLKNEGFLKSIFHAGQNGNEPYSILAKDKRMCFTYAASSIGCNTLVAGNSPRGCIRFWHIFTQWQKAEY